ncbi:hypothetical protein G210_3419, partial [Candida maltosa Xu316]
DKPIGGLSEIITTAINSTGTRIVYSRTDKTIRIWKSTADSAVDPKIIQDAHSRAVESISFNPRTEYTFATVGKDEFIKIWHAGTGQLLQEIKGQHDLLKLVRYSDDGKRLIVVDKLSNILIYNCEMNYQFVHKFKLNDHVYDLQWFHFKHKFFLTALNDGSILLFELGKSKNEETGEVETVCKIRTRLEGHNSSITSLAVSPNRSFFCVGSSEGVISFWNCEETFINSHVITDVDQSIAQLDCSRDSSYIAVSYDTDSNSRIYDYDSAELMYEVPNTESGNQTFSSITWFPSKTGFICTTDGCTTLTLMRKPKDNRLGRR